MGPLMGSKMSHVDFRKCRIFMSLVFHNVTWRIKEKGMLHITLLVIPMSHMSLGPMSHVEFKKCPCRPVYFRDQCI